MRNLHQKLCRTLCIIIQSSDILQHEWNHRKIGIKNSVPAQLRAMILASTNTAEATWKHPPGMIGNNLKWGQSTCKLNGSSDPIFYYCLNTNKKDAILALIPSIQELEILLHTGVDVTPGIFPASFSSTKTCWELWGNAVCPSQRFLFYFLYFFSYPLIDC